MDSVVDAILWIVGRAVDSWLGMFALTSPIWLLAGRRSWQALQRRRAFQAFAAARQFQFLGTIASDARAPYTRFHQVKRAVLLSNVVEGQAEGVPVRVFDMPTGGTLRWTMILVTVEGTLLRGTEAERLIAAGPPAALIEANLDVLGVSPKRPLAPSELSTWVAFAIALAKAMERDEKDARRFDLSAPAPAPERPMFGRFSAD
jgi:hypothetical protein